MFDKDNKFGFINNNESNNNNNNNIKNTDLPYTISSKVLATVPASDIKIDDNIIINNISINKDRRYYIEFLGIKKLCSLSVDEEEGNAIICGIGNYGIGVCNDLTNISITINKINEDNTTTDTFTDLIIHEEEVKYLDSKYLETDLTLQNSISMGRVGDIGYNSSAIGYKVKASGSCSHAEGQSTISSGSSSHAEGYNATAIGMGSHAEGQSTISSGESSHAEGNSTEASGKYAHAEGDTTTASGDYGSHAEGSNTIASGVGSHAEGDCTTASAYYSHAEGDSTTASAYGSHAEGKYTTASGTSSHAEGDSTTASEYCSHAEGNCTTASGENSHAEGAGTIASGENQHVQGKYNIEDTANKYAHIVGNGEDGKNSNAHTLDWKGNAWYSGKLSQEGTPTEDKDLVTKKYVDDKVTVKLLPVEYDNGKIVNVKNLEAHSTYICPNDVDLLDLEYEKESKLVAFLITPNKEQLIYVGNKTDKQIELMVGVNSYVIHFKTETQAGSMERNVYYLTPNNNTAFTPTKDYNPAHKKYVDDKVSSLPQISFNENGELVVTINGVSKIFVPKSE